MGVTGEENRYLEAELPEGFVCRMKKLLGEEFFLFLASYQKPRTQGLRFNGLKAKSGKAAEKEDAGKVNKDEEKTGNAGGSGALERDCRAYFSLEEVLWAEGGFTYAKEDRPGKHPYHEAGLYYIQEPSAMAAAEALEVRPGEIVLDLCAAPGGKSTQIAAHLQGKGLLVSNEIHPARAKILSQNIERMGAANVVVTNHDARTMAEWLPEFFDKIIVDAPCSGEGMFRKEPEARKEWMPDSPGQCSRRQKEILGYAAAMLKPGGKLVYSTCTFAPEENEGTIEAFLRNHAEFFIEDMTSRKKGFAAFGQGRPDWVDEGGRKELEATCRLWPHKIHGEGHYLAVLGKRAAEEGKGTSAANLSGKTGEKRGKESRERNKGNHLEGMGSRELKKVFRAFCQEVFCAGDWKFEDRFMFFGEQLYAVPKHMPDIRGKKVLRPGLHLGSFKKNRFEPSHALALYLNIDQVKQYVNLDSRGEWVIRYLKGEALPVEEVLSDGKKKFLVSTDSEKEFLANMVSGWVLVAVDGYSLGWAKLAGGRLQNHYPKGLRWG